MVTVCGRDGGCRLSVNRIVGLNLGEKMRAAAVHTVTEEHRDPLHGPVHTVPSEVGRARTRYRTVPSKNHRFRKVVDFASMFSEHPLYAIKAEPADPGPAFAAPEQLRKNEQARLRKECRVTGADYWKYFKRPLIPSSHLLLPHVLFAQKDFVIPGQQPTHFTVGVQTDYRESETQTDPYSPECVIRRGATASELLRMAALSWGRGLPAGLDEVEMIEWAREKQAWETRLPPLDDKSQLNRRRRMLEEILVKEWALRDAKIQKLQEARLALLKDQLRQRHVDQQEASFERINQMYSEYEEEKETRRQKIHHDYMRSLRKLEAKRKMVESKRERSDIVTEFQKYLLTDSRTNQFGSQNSNKDVQIHEELHQSVPKPGIKMHKPKVNNLNPTRVGKAVDLLMKYKAQTEEEKTHEKKRPLRFLVKKKKITPLVSAREKSPSQSEEETELAVIVLQKLLRGRRMQYEMCKGVEDNRDLMRELRTVHSIHSEEQELLKADEELVTALKNKRDQQRQKVSEKEAFCAGVVGAEQELLFDALSKEMVRLQEERRIHAFALLADRERRRREAEESGRRQEEERRRREEDEIFRQVVQVHQQSVDMYLEDIILETLEKMSGEKAREQIHKKLKELNEISYAMEKSLDKRQSEEIVSELLYSHLIPGVEKNIFWQNVRQKQRKHLQAAQSIIQETAAPSGTLAASQPTYTEASSTEGKEDEISRAKPEQS